MMRPTIAHFITCNLYLSGNLVRLALNVVVQNYRNFMEFFLLHTLVFKPSIREYFDKNVGFGLFSDTVIHYYR